MKLEREKVRDLLHKIINLELTDPRIIEYILENHNKIPYIDFSQFIKELGIEEIKANKFLSDNGYDNFIEFKSKFSDALVNFIRINDSSFLHQVVTFDRSEISGIINMIAEVEAKNMENMLVELDYDKFVNLIKDIMNSPELIIIGTRVSETHANYASSLLNKIGIKVKKIISADTSSFDNIQNYDRSSLVIAFGFKRYPKETIKLLNYFNRKNFKIISITDEPDSPLCNFSNYSIFVQAHSLAYTDSFINGLILINAIAIAIGKMNKDMVVRRLRDFEETAKTMDYFW